MLVGFVGVVGLSGRWVSGQWVSGKWVSRAFRKYIYGLYGVKHHY